MRVLRDTEIVAGVVLVAAVIAAAYYYYATVNGVDSGLRQALSNVPIISSAGGAAVDDDGSTGAALTWLGEWL